MPNSRVTTLKDNSNNNCCSSSNFNSSATQSVLAPLRAVLQERQHPPFVSLQINRNILRFMSLWPLKWQHKRQQLYSACNSSIIFLLTIFALTITCDLYEASADFVLFGDDLVVLLGLYLILLKIWLYRLRTNDIEDIIQELTRLHLRQAQLQLEKLKIHKLQRNFFLCEIFSLSLYMTLAIFFAAAICIQPLFTEQPLPYRAKFPFDLQDPTLFSLAYLFQCICTIYNLTAIVLIDNLGCHTFSQTTLNLQILCLRIRQLGENGICGSMWHDLREIVRDHQHIIGLIDQINRIFYSNYVAQMTASTFIICLTAFEALLAKDQPMLALKFQFYMLLSFMQLFYWCWMGNMVYFDLLSTSYSYFALLRTMND